VSLDLDVFDLADAPGVGSPAPGGICASNFLDAWADLTCSPHCIGAEIVEYNPHRDQSGHTAQLISALVVATVPQERSRSSIGHGRGSKGLTLGRSVGPCLLGEPGVNPAQRGIVDARTSRYAKTHARWQRDPEGIGGALRENGVRA
jgi:hypothetical protein